MDRFRKELPCVMQEDIYRIQMFSRSNQQNKAGVMPLNQYCFEVFLDLRGKRGSCS